MDSDSPAHANAVELKKKDGVVANTTSSPDTSARPTPVADEKEDRDSKPSISKEMSDVEEKEKIPAKSPTDAANDKQDSSTTGSGDANKSIKADRGKICPFLLRTFCQYGVHHVPEDFLPRSLPVKHEIQIYTWKDATMREIGNLIRNASANAASEPSVKMSFRLVFRNKANGRFLTRDLGVVIPGRHPSRDEEKTLADVRFEVGDYLDVALFSGNERRPEGPRGVGGPVGSRGGPVGGPASFSRGPAPGEHWDSGRVGSGGPRRDEPWGHNNRGNGSGAWGDRDRNPGGGGGGGPMRRDRSFGFGGRDAPNSGGGDWGRDRDRKDRSDDGPGSFRGSGPGLGGGQERGGRGVRDGRDGRRYEPYRDTRGR